MPKPIADGSFYIQRSNQDFWLREHGVWIRKGNIRDEGSGGIIDINPVVNFGYNMHAAVTRTRFLGSVAHDLGIDMAAAISLIREVSSSQVYGFAMTAVLTHEQVEEQVAAAMSMGFDMSATLYRETLATSAMQMGFTMNAIVLIRARLLVANMLMGTDQASALTRTTYETPAMQQGFDMSATVTHVAPALPKFLVIGLAQSPWVMWYDSSLTAISAPATGPASTVTSIAFSPDGNTCIVATATALYRYDTSTTTPSYIGAFPSAPAWSAIKDVSWNAAGDRIIVADSATSPYLWVYNTSTWASTTAPAGSVGLAAASWDGTANSKVAIGRASTTIRLYDTPAMTVTASNLGTQPSVPVWLNVAFSPDGAYCAGHAAQNPSPMRVWQLSSRAAPLANPATMPHVSSCNDGKALSWNPASNKFALCESFGTSIYNVSGTTVALDTTINYNSIGGAQPLFRRDGAKLFLTQVASPRFAVYTVSGWTKDTDPATQPAGTPTAIGSSI